MIGLGPTIPEANYCLSKEFLCLDQRIRQTIDLVAGVVEGERSSGRSRNAHSFHEGLRAVMASTDRDTFAVEDGADIVGVCVFENEGDHGCLFFGS